MKTANLEINGMTGRASVNGVRSALSVIRGVAGVEVSLESRQANVCFDPHKAIPEQFKKAVWVMGCEVEKISVQGRRFLGKYQRWCELPVSNSLSENLRDFRAARCYGFSNGEKPAMTRV